MGAPGNGSFGYNYGALAQLVCIFFPGNPHIHTPGSTAETIHLIFFILFGRANRPLFPFNDNLRLSHAAAPIGSGGGSGIFLDLHLPRGDCGRQPSFPNFLRKRRADTKLKSQCAGSTDY
jgi:hypothetical protein